ncbi:MAG TPA: ATP-binding protein, partial [Candidatus Obscuribacterales bacterium]
MKRFPLPLRFSIPGFLLLFGSLLGIFSFQKELSVSHLRTESDAMRQIRFSGDQTSGMLEYLFRQGDVGGADLVISKLGGNPNLNLAVLCDENNKIILATRYELRNRLLINTPAAKSLSKLERVRQRMSGEVRLSADKQSIQAIYPVILGSASGELRPTKVGALFLEYDLSDAKQRAYADALRRSLESSAVLALFCALLWFFFDKTVTKRAVRLVDATNSLAKGELSVRANLQGSDELAQISAAFDQMAEKIQANQQELKELAQREELLNRLASQIRNSLDLETILQTAVQEIHSLLQLDRCSFLWYRPNGLGVSDTERNPESSGLDVSAGRGDEQPDNAKLPYWELVHETKNFDLPSHMGCYSSEVIGPLAQKVLDMEMLRINDVKTLDEPVMQKLLSSLGHRAMLILPIQTRTGKIGAVTCSHFGKTRLWSDTEVELLQAVTDQLAIAIDQAELYEQSRVAATTATDQAEQLKQALQKLQQTQAQLIQTEKMSSLGQLVAGVAHEINNPVSFIHGNLTHINQYTQDLLEIVQLYQQSYPNLTPEIQKLISDIDLEFLIEDLPKVVSSMKMGTDRIREIVLSLRNFSRLDEAEMKQVDIHEGINSTLLILQNRLKAKPNHPDIKIVKDYGNLPQVQCYAGQLNQVFMNILSNAIDAIDNYNNSRSTKEIRNNLSQITIRTEVSNPDSVTITLSDNGPGMTEEVKKRLFDPFFTTKPVGKGTGLGLSISYQIIVEKHSGSIWCESEPGKGTE